MANADSGKAPAAKSVTATPNPTKKPATAESDRRDAFARALTRAMFGRYYWDDSLEAEKQRASRKHK